jgi:hypothetical protein
MILHLSHIFLTEALTFISFCSALSSSWPLHGNDPSTGRVAGSEFHQHPVALPQPDEIPSYCRRQMGHHLPAVI